MFLISKKREEKKEKETRILAIVGTKKPWGWCKGNGSQLGWVQVASLTKIKWNEIVSLHFVKTRPTVSLWTNGELILGGIQTHGFQNWWTGCQFISSSCP